MHFDETQTWRYLKQIGFIMHFSAHNEAKISYRYKEKDDSIADFIYELVKLNHSANVGFAKAIYPHFSCVNSNCTIEVTFILYTGLYTNETFDKRVREVISCSESMHMYNLPNWLTYQ